ncbi:helix-turn-helix domain-containing protein [Pseudahrensia aquimaris]|uniref:Helix-turn-helix domain-containing protein n=1 Tax=Pseudahrensia aquimaris TaxID=744461 RepID=A0ABW3FB69_9HYPH
MYVTSPNHYVDSDISRVSRDFLASEVFERAAIRSLPEESLLFCEGDEAVQVYEILEGVVRTSKVLCDGRRQIISFGYPGDLVGISHDCRYHYDCETVSEVKLRAHRKNACSANSQTEPEFCKLLLKHTAFEMNSMQEHFLMLGRKSALEKICSFLVVLLDKVAVEENGLMRFQVPMYRSDIADFLGLTIETVSRTITKLRKDGVIDLPKPNEIIVCQPAKLRALAERSE